VVGLEEALTDLDTCCGDDVVVHNNSRGKSRVSGRRHAPVCRGGKHTRQRDVWGSPAAGTEGRRSTR